MRSVWVRIIGLTWVTTAGLMWGLQQGRCPECRYDAQEFERKMQDYQSRLQASALHQRAKAAAGGNLQTTRKALAANLYGDMASLMKASDEVLLVHIIRNAGMLAPSGEDPITLYTAFVLSRWKGHSLESVTFSTPAGSVAFDQHTRATTTVQGFAPPLNGKRYVLFLRFARGEEAKLTPALRLTGDAVQGAFELNNEQVQPSFHLDPLFRAYRNAPVRKFMDEINSLASAQGVYAPKLKPTPVPGGSKPTFELSGEHLQEVNLHLPSYMPTVSEFMLYQDTLPSHQMLKIQWDSMPGRQGPIPKHDVEGIPLVGNFVLLESQKMPGRAGKTGLLLASDTLVLVGADSHGEVRGLRVEQDPREWHSESLQPGRPYQRSDFIYPKSDIYTHLPDDPEIDRIILLKPRLRNPVDPGRGTLLDQIGVLKLKQ